MTTETHNININVTDKGTVKVVTKDISDMGTTAKKTTGDLSGLTQILSTLAAVAGVDKLREYVDTYTKMSGQIRSVSKDAAEYKATEQALYDASQRSRTGMEATVGLYSRLKATTGSLKLSNTELIGTTETLNKLMVVSGANGDTAKNALVQLGQGLGAGALRGEEFNSVVEATNGLFKDVLSKSLGVAKGQLNDYAEAGKLTSKVVIDALKKSKTEIEAAFSSTPLTIGAAFTNLNSAIQRFIGLGDQATGISGAIAQGIQFITDNINLIGGSLAVFASFVGVLGAFSAAVRLASFTMAAFNVVVGLNPFVLLAASIAAVIALIINFHTELGITDEKWEEMKVVAVAVWGEVKARGMELWEFLKIIGGAIKDLIMWFVDLGVKAVKAVDDIIDRWNKFWGIQKQMTTATGVEIKATDKATESKIRYGAANDLASNQVASNTKANNNNTGSIKGTSDATSDYVEQLKSLTSTMSSMYGKSFFAWKPGFGPNEGPGSWKYAQEQMKKYHEDYKKLIEDETKANDEAYQAAINLGMAQQKIGVAEGATAATTAGPGGEPLVRNLKGAHGGYTSASTAAAVGGGGSFSGTITQLPKGVDSMGNLIYSPGPTPVGQQNKFSDAITKMGYKGIADIPGAMLDATLRKAYMQSLQGFKDGGVFTVGGSGGSDSRMVQFMATPGEQVTVTPADKSRPIHVNMTIQTNDADSFRLNQQQVLSDLEAGISRAVRSA